MSGGIVGLAIHGAIPIFGLDELRLHAETLQLPFALPSSAEMLLSFGEREPFGPFHGGSTSRPSTPAPAARSFTVGYSEPPKGVEAEQGLAPGVGGGSDGLRPASSNEGTPKDTNPRFIPVLPDGFLQKLDAARARTRPRETFTGHTRVGGLGVNLSGSTSANARNDAVRAWRDLGDWRARMPTDAEFADDDNPRWESESQPPMTTPRVERSNPVHA